MQTKKKPFDFRNLNYLYIQDKVNRIFFVQKLNRDKKLKNSFSFLNFFFAFSTSYMVKRKLFIFKQYLCFLLKLYFYKINLIILFN